MTSSESKVLIFYICDEEKQFHCVFPLKNKKNSLLTLIISRRALAREGDYEMMPVCACVRVCVR